MIKVIKVSGRKIGQGERCFVIAEAGVNHNGDVAIAMKLIKAAKEAGADCVKFQTFKAEQLVTADAPKAQYQLEVTDRSESQFVMLKKLELSVGAYKDLLAYCKELDIIFLSTPYNIEDIEFLEALGVSAYKVASGQIVEPLFLTAVAKTGKPIYLSTGMATLAEVDEAVRTIRGAGNDQLILLQCTTNYPSRHEDANLLTIPIMANAFKTIVGYSDHTQSNTACLVAIGLGARVIEKHLTLNKTMPGPDHSSSADPEEFRQLVSNIREADLALGSGVKEPCPAEIENARGMRRSIVAARKILAGEIFSENMLAIKRPGIGIRPALMVELLGRSVVKNINEDDLIDWDMVGQRANSGRY